MCNLTQLNVLYADDTEEINSSPNIDHCPDCSSKLFYYNDPQITLNTLIG